MKWTALACALLFSIECFAAAPSIGTVTSAGQDETTLSDGSGLKTENLASDVRLDNGVALHLGPRTTSTVFADHAVIEAGAARLSHFGGYAVNAGGLHIEAETPETEAVVRVQPNQTIEIASLGGPVTVSAGGALLTRVAAGTRASFQNTGASPAQTGAAPGHRARKHLSATQVWVIAIVGVAAAALAIGLTRSSWALTAWK